MFLGENCRRNVWLVVSIGIPCPVDEIVRFSSIAADGRELGGQGDEVTALAGAQTFHLKLDIFNFS